MIINGCRNEKLGALGHSCRGILIFSNFEIASAKIEHESQVIELSL